ncbi:MAG TPA: hypothetical protein VF175_00960 [Lacipirellula sp.]
MSKILVAAVVLLGAGGCRMCSDSCDYSPPVAGSPYNAFTARAGSVTTTAVELNQPAAPQPLPPAPPITQPPAP